MLPILRFRRFRRPRRRTLPWPPPRCPRRHAGPTVPAARALVKARQIKGTSFKTVLAKIKPLLDAAGWTQEA